MKVPEVPVNDAFTMSKFAEIILGWFLGVVSGPVLKWISSYRERKQFIKGLRIELTEVRFRLASSLYGIARDIGKFDRDFLIWMKAEVQTYSGVYPTVKVAAGFDSLLQLDDANMALVQQYIAATAGNEGKSIPYAQTPYLDSKLDKVASLSEKQQALLLNIKRGLSIVNRKIDEAAMWEKMTFEVTNVANHTAVIGNSNACLGSMFTAAQESIGSMKSYLEMTQ